MTTEAMQEMKAGEAGIPRGQKLVFYHPTSGGGGSALQLEPRLNRQDSDRYNCFFMDLAPQKTAANRSGDKPVPATFDWEHKLTVKLDFADICELLAVLEGRAEKAGGQKNGLYHSNGGGSTIIALQKQADKPGYFLGLSRKDNSGNQLARVHITLSEPEALGLRCVFQSSLFLLTFHAQLFAALGGRPASG